MNRLRTDLVIRKKESSLSDARAALRSPVTLREINVDNVDSVME